MVSIEEVDDVEIEVLLKPDDIRFGSMEYLKGKGEDDELSVASRKGKKENWSSP